MNRILNIIFSTVAILCVGLVYSYAAPLVGENQSDQYFRNLGFAMGGGVFFLPVIFLLRKLFPRAFKEASVTGFRFYALSTVLATILFVPIRVDQVREENQLYYAGKILAEPYGAVYATCLGVDYLNEKCVGMFEEGQFQPAPVCKSLLPSDVPSAVRTSFDEFIASVKMKEMTKSDIYQNVDILLAQASDPKEACVQGRVKLDILFKMANNNYQDALAKFRAAAYP